MTPIQHPRRKRPCRHPLAIGLGDAPPRCIRYYCERCGDTVIEQVDL